MSPTVRGGSLQVFAVCSDLVGASTPPLEAGARLVRQRVRLTDMSIFAFDSYLSITAFLKHGSSRDPLAHVHRHARNFRFPTPNNNSSAVAWTHFEVSDIPTARMRSS